MKLLLGNHQREGKAIGGLLKIFKKKKKKKKEEE